MLEGSFLKNDEFLVTDSAFSVLGVNHASFLVCDLQRRRLKWCKHLVLFWLFDQYFVTNTQVSAFGNAAFVCILFYLLLSCGISLSDLWGSFIVLHPR